MEPRSSFRRRAREEKEELKSKRARHGVDIFEIIIHHNEDMYSRQESLYEYTPSIPLDYNWETNAREKKKPALVPVIYIILRIISDGELCQMSSKIDK